MKKVVIAGGSGQLGSILSQHFSSQDVEVVVLSRKPTTSSESLVRHVQWDGQTLMGKWVEELECSDLLINLTVRTVNCRYTWKNRCEMLCSRTRSVRALGSALARIEAPPALWVQASTATIYEHSFDVAHDENNGVLGGLEEDTPTTWRGSIDVARAWEGEFALFDTPQTRKVLLRSSMVMSPDKGGIFDHLLWLTRLGLGGTAGSGNQYVSWIHSKDFVRAVECIVGDDRISGAANVTAPHPISNSEFMRLLRDAWGMPIGLPAPEFMIALGTWFLRTESELVLKSRRVIPGVLIQSGFSFDYPAWQSASKDLCAQWRELRR